MTCLKEPSPVDRGIQATPVAWVVFSRGPGEVQWTERARGASFPDAESHLIELKEAAELWGTPSVAWMIFASETPPGAPPPLPFPMSPRVGDRDSRPAALPAGRLPDSLPGTPEPRP